MMKSNKDKQIVSKHPYEAYIPAGATKLIIGSMAPMRFCITPQRLEKDDIRFYYGSHKNHFWHLMETVTGEKLDFENTDTAIEQRKNLLKKLNTGITDIVERCIHIDGKSDDKSLKIIKYKPIMKLLLEHKNINTLICTSAFVKNELKKITHGKYHKETEKKGTLEINNKKYSVIILYSPSPYALVGMGPNGVQKRLAQYKEAFKNE